MRNTGSSEEQDKDEREKKPFLESWRVSREFTAKVGMMPGGCRGEVVQSVQLPWMGLHGR